MNESPMTSRTQRIFSVAREWPHTSLYTAVMVTIILLLEVLERFS